MRCKATGKVMHHSRHCAHLAKNKVGKEKGIVLAVYHCSHCNKWHLGNTRNTHLENMNRLFDRIATQGAL